MFILTTPIIIITIITVVAASIREDEETVRGRQKEFTKVTLTDVV